MLRTGRSAVQGSFDDGRRLRRAVVFLAKTATGVSRNG